MKECPTGKQRYHSKKDARQATRNASWRLRLYRCHDCSGWHTTNNEQGHHKPFKE